MKSTEAQLIALLEWMGWKPMMAPERQVHWVSPEGIKQNSVPALTLDLMHEAIMRAYKVEGDWVYNVFLNRLTALNPADYWNATAAQRLEALVITLNLESESSGLNRQDVAWLLELIWYLEDHHKLTSIAEKPRSTGT